MKNRIFLGGLSAAFVLELVVLIMFMLPQKENGHI